MNIMRRSLFFTIMAVLSMPALGAGIIDPVLQQKMEQESGPHEVIVTFKSMDAVDSLSSTLGVDVIALQTLPMAGAILTESQIEQVRQWDSVRSIYFNAPLEYSNYTSGEITGGHFVHDNYAVKGAGTTIAVLDSGVDASHPDLALGTKTIQNVKIIGDLGLAGGVNVFLEGQLNTDTTSGHGTHVAGTVGGTGAASADDERRAFYFDGIAPEANLVGLGAGEGIAILYALLGFDYAIANQNRYGIDVITNSWGGGDGNEFDPNNPINQASFEAYSRGMVVTFAASNSGPDEDTLNQYAIAPWVINVAAGTSDKQLASFSSRGVAGDFYKHPDITAPGNLITSTRAPNTAIGALGPVVDPNHPDYYLYYHTISGTSMATPFVAGTVGLLLEVNPQLSPDQIEDVLMASAEAMPGYEFHEVGAGYIDVRAAVDTARNTVGERDSFLDGDTEWSSQGTWNAVGDQSDLLVYNGKWHTVSATDASDGVYHKINAKHGGSAYGRFVGRAVKFEYPMGPKGGLADVYVDGVNKGRISFYNDTQTWGNMTAVADAGDADHMLELRAVKDEVYFDTLLVDGQAFPLNVTFEDTTTTYTGTMGPSVENLSIHTIHFDVGSDVTNIRAELGWDGLFDLDLYLIDPHGNTVASGATLANPEFLEYVPKEPGVYTYEITGYISVTADYTLHSTLTRVVQN